MVQNRTKIIQLYKKLYRLCKITTKKVIILDVNQYFNPNFKIE